MDGKISTPLGKVKVELTTPMAPGSSDIAIDGPYAKCSEAYWSGDREYTIINNCDRTVRYEINECLIGCITRVIRVRKGGQEQATLLGNGLGIEEPIRAL